MRLLSKTLTENASNLLYLTIAATLAIAFLWAVAEAKESKPAKKAEQIVASEQKTEVGVLRKQKSELHIGTYNPQQVFNMYYGTQNLRKQVQQLQTENKMTQEQLQQMVKQEEQRLIRQFQTDLSEVIPQLAKDANVPIIAVQMVYREPSVEIKDLTVKLVNSINQLADQASERNSQPVLKQPLQPETNQK